MENSVIIILGFANLLTDSFAMSVGAYLSNKSVFKMGLVTYISIVSIGLIPLMIYVWDNAWGFPGSLFLWTSIFTLLAFLFFGFLKFYVKETSKLKKK